MRRSRPLKRASRVDPRSRAPLDPVARNTLRLLALTLRRAGYSAQDLASQFEQFVVNAPQPLSAAGSHTERDFHDTGHVLTLWSSDPDYVDEDGLPRAIPARGPAPSVEALLERARPNWSLEKALELFLRTGTLERTGRKLIPADDLVIHSPASKTLSTHHVLVLNQLLRNFEFNSKRKRGDSRWLQRVAECPDFPANQLSTLLSRFAQDAARFMKSYDQRMARMARRADPHEPRVRPALNLFFAVNPPSRSRKKTR